MRYLSYVAAGLFLCFSAQAWANGPVEGTLRDTSGAPLAHTKLILQDGRGATAASTTSDDAGHFAFSPVPDGSYVMMAMQGDQVLGSATTSVAGQPVHKDLSLQSEQALNVVIEHWAQLRNQLSPQTGATAYQVDNAAIEALPQGADTSLDKVLLQTPGVAQDSAASGLLHIRGEHADLQYRLNGILLPEGISGFGETLDSRIIDNMTLLDGTLPAQYGYRTAGVVNIQTKSGLANSGTAEMYGGSNNTLEPSVTYGGTLNSADYFFTASHLSSDLGIESPTPSGTPIHDHTEQDKQFGYASYMINPMQRVEMVAGNAVNYFQIPNNPGQTSNFTDGSTSSFNSADLNERQFESNQYATVAWQGSHDDVDLQIAPYVRQSETHFRPDPTGDLIFNGIAADVQNSDLAAGLQADGSYKLNTVHTLRAGLLIQDETAVEDNTSQVFAGGVNADGTPFQTGTTPITIADDHEKEGQLYGVYIQDEWKLTDRLTMNYGARFDQVDEYVNENQISPRIGFVYKADEATTLHAGYARYFTPPPMELVAPTTLALFNGTTAQPAVTQDNAVKAERTHSFDIGATHQLTDQIKLGIDSYYKLSHDLLDEGQFGPALILTPFNYEHGRVYGTELSATYTGKDVKAYANLAWSRALGEDIVSAQFNFTDPAELAYIQNNYVHLDHDQTYTASGGASYTVREGTELGLDSIFGSGLRSGFANEDHVPPYIVFNGSVTQDLNLFPHDKTQLRFTVVNLLDSTYELRDGTGIGVGAPQWGARRGFFVSLAQDF